MGLPVITQFFTSHGPNVTATPATNASSVGREWAIMELRGVRALRSTDGMNAAAIPSGNTVEINAGYLHAAAEPASAPAKDQALIALDFCDWRCAQTAARVPAS